MSTAKCIDVSDHNGVIDWKKVKAAGIDYAILRTGYGFSYKDKQLLNNAKNAVAAGIKIVGFYHFSYAATPEDARIEASKAVSYVRETGITNVPIFFDYEYDTLRYLRNNLKLNPTYKGCISATSMFCDYVKQSGFRYGVYANKDFWDNWYNEGKGVTGYFWYADWRTSPDKELVELSDIHQYTGTGTVNGITGNVDISIIYDESLFTTKETETSINKLAEAVINGDYGNGDERKKKLGSLYDQVQKRVNEILASKDTPKKKSTDELVKEVIDGKWGNGDERKKRLTDAGYDYRTIQDAVNKTLKPSSPSVSPAQSFDKSLSGNYKVTAFALNMRYVPGLQTNDNVMKILNKNETVNCYGYYTYKNNSKWLYVKFGNYTGYVDSKYVTRI